jgi:hypothetical protein
VEGDGVMSKKERDDTMDAILSRAIGCFSWVCVIALLVIVIGFILTSQVFNP